MFRAALAFVLTLIPLAVLSQEVKPAPADKPLEATKSEEGVWTLGEQVWDFSAVSLVYKPLKGDFDQQANTVVWTLELAKELTSAEATAHNVQAGSPFKPSFIDLERLLLADDARVKITPVTGIKGDRIKMTVQMPKAEILSKAKLVRVGKRTGLGF